LDNIEYVNMPLSGPIFDGAVEEAIKALGLPNFFVSMDMAKIDANKAITAALDYVKANTDSGVVPTIHSHIVSK
jgi:hypothetical protein